MGNKLGKKTKHVQKQMFIYRPSSPPEGHEFSHWKLIPSTIPGYELEYIPVHRKKSDSIANREENYRPRSRTLQDEQAEDSIEVVSKYFINPSTTGNEGTDEKITEQEQTQGKRQAFSMYDLEKLSTQGFSYAC